VTVATIAEQDPEQAAKPSCFVIGPIGDEHAEHGSPGRKVYEQSLRVYEQVIRAACRKHGFEPVRADAIADAGEITEQIERRLDEADIVIADVSGGNPNVMYELGLRDGKRKPVILVGEYGMLPFDIARKRTILFRRHPDSLFQARDQLDRFLAEGISKGFSAALAAGAAQGSTSELVPVGEAEEADDSPGAFERLAEAEADMESVIADIEAMGEALLGIAAVAEESTPQMKAVSQSNAPMSAKLAVVKQFADAVTAPAAAFRASADTFAERMSGINSGVQVSLDFIEAQPPEDRDADTKEFLTQLIQTAEATRSGTAEIAGFGSVMKSVVGYSRLLRGPVRDIAEAVRTVTTAVACMDTWEVRARRLL